MECFTICCLPIEKFHLMQKFMCRDFFNVFFTFPLFQVNVSLSNLNFVVGNLKYDIESQGGKSTDLNLIYIIVGVGCGLLIIVILFACCLYRRKKRQQEKKERTYEMQMNSLESKVAKECREGMICY